MTDREANSPKLGVRDPWANLIVVITVAFVPGASGCAGPGGDGPSGGPRGGVNSTHVTDAASRARRNYSKAFVLRPVLDNVAERAAELAPLFVLEATHEPVPMPACFGPKESEAGVAETNRPSCVYFAVSEWKHNGRVYDQVTYLFVIPEADGRLPGSWRGVRISLGADGFPIVWEVLTGESDDVVLFVSASFEAAARSEFGSPAPGRTFFSERPGGKAPRSEVARVLDDGPVPMGPYLYVAAEQSAIDGVLCRCMPAQFEESLGTHDYQLRPVESLGTAARGALKVLDAPQSLADRLRWPKGL